MLNSLTSRISLGASSTVKKRELPFKVMVFGEPYVGKTAYIRAMATDCSYDSIPYEHTTKITTNVIPAKEEDEIEFVSTPGALYGTRLSRIVSNFITCYHSMFIRPFATYCQRGENGEEYKWQKELGQKGKRRAAYWKYPEIYITEMPQGVDYNEYSIKWDTYDLFILMADFTDITTMRGPRFKIEKWGLPVSKTVVCLNMCDVEFPECNNFGNRKAKILEYYAYDLGIPVEFISVKTRHNLDFLYRYLV